MPAVVDLGVSFTATQQYPAVLTSLTYLVFDCGYSPKLQEEGPSSSSQASLFPDTDTPPPSPRWGLRLS